MSVLRERVVCFAMSASGVERGARLVKWRRMLVRQERRDTGGRWCKERGHVRAAGQHIGTRIFVWFEGERRGGREGGVRGE